MPIYEKKAYLMVEADSPQEAEDAFNELDSTSIGCIHGDVGIALDESPAYDQEPA